ncbi:MAG TPA: ribosomal protein S18-alanine N-acetyltransferase [Terriglobales bacterium]|nr:ribosomal protein S18-alanine N-acetyltransferase [Terriglobales bacterium]
MPVRPATAADIPLIMQLERDSPTAAHWSETHYKTLFSESIRLALIIDDVGFLIAHHIDIEWEIENILVAANVRRRGLASQLMRTFLATARQQNAEYIFLEVRESNHAAQAFYEKHGFQASGRRTNYYRTPDEDALTYRLDLPKISD